MLQSSRRDSANLWPSGDSRAVVVLAFEPEEITRRYGLRFQEDVDDLDTVIFTVLPLGDGSNALLYKHVGDPNPGTVVNVDARANLLRERELLIDALHLEDRNLLWVASEAQQQQARGAYG